MARLTNWITAQPKRNRLSVKKPHHFRGETYPLDECRAEMTVGPNHGDHISAGRVLAGGVLFGPAGAAVGALARKNTTTVRVAVWHQDTLVVDEALGLASMNVAENFVNTVNRTEKDN